MWPTEPRPGVFQRRWWTPGRGDSKSPSLEDASTLLKWSFMLEWCLGACNPGSAAPRQAPAWALRDAKLHLASTWGEREKGPRLLISYFITLLQYCGWLSTWEWLSIQFWFCKLLRDRSLYPMLLHFRMNKGSDVKLLFRNHNYENPIKLFKRQLELPRSPFLFCDEKNLCFWAVEENPAHNCMFHRSYKLCKTSDCNGNKNNPVMVAGAKWSSTLKIAWPHSPVAWVLNAHHSEIIHLSFLPMVTESHTL